MLNNYKLYFDNLPALESMCQAAGVVVEPFLCAGVSHVVVTNKLKVCPNIQSKVHSLNIKVITARAVHKWLIDYNIVKKRNSSPPKVVAPTSPEKPVVTQRVAMVVADSKNMYKPQFIAKVDVPFYPDHACNGSAWAMQMCPGQQTQSKTTTVLHQSKSRTATLQQSRKLFCENCRVSVTDLDEHLATLQHLRYANNCKNFAQLDAVIGDLTLENMLSQCNKRRKVQ